MNDGYSNDELVVFMMKQQQINQVSGCDFENSPKKKACTNEICLFEPSNEEIVRFLKSV